eukprot:Platyproteum_vivax@DN601_c0_g1_i2.p1
MYNQAPNSYNPATPITFGNDPIQQQNPSTQTYSNAQPQQYGQAQQQSAQQPQQYAQQPQPYGQQPQQMNQQPQLIGQQSPQQYVVLNPQQIPVYSAQGPVVHPYHIPQMVALPQYTVPGPYVGKRTWCVTVAACFCIGPFALCIPLLCPIDMDDEGRKKKEEKDKIKAEKAAAKLAAKK